jgi:hypothetical protein
VPEGLFIAVGLVGPAAFFVASISLRGGCRVGFHKTKERKSDVQSL